MAVGSVLHFQGFVHHHLHWEKDHFAELNVRVVKRTVKFSLTTVNFSLLPVRVVKRGAYSRYVCVTVKDARFEHSGRFEMR